MSHCYAILTPSPQNFMRIMNFIWLEGKRFQIPESLLQEVCMELGRQWWYTTLLPELGRTVYNQLQLKLHLLAEPSGLERELGRPHFPGEFLSDPLSFIKEGIQQSQKLKDNYRILTLESRFLSIDIRDWRSRQRPGNLTCTELWFYNVANVQSAQSLCFAYR